MSLFRQGILKSLAGELLTLRPAEYLILLDKSTVQFARVHGRGRTTVLVTEDGSGEEPGTFARFCETLVKNPAYFGQPIRILINNGQAFSYIKRQGKLSAAQLYEKVSAIPKDNLEVRQAVMQRGKNAFFVWQGVRKDFLESMKKIALDFRLRITDIVPIETVLLAGGPVPAEDEGALYLYRLPSETWRYGIFKSSGDVLFNRTPVGTENCAAAELRSRLAQSLGPWVATPTERDIDYQRTTRTADRLGRILRSQVKQPKALGTLSYRSDDWKGPIAYRTAINSSRLLAMSLVGICLFLALATAVTSLWAGSGSAPLGAFQELYSSKLALTRELDSLGQLEKDLIDRQGEPRKTAAIVSAFCQQSFPGLNLGGVTIDYTKDQAPTVEARGISSREATIFALREHLAGLVESYSSVTVNSVRPQLRASKAAADTSFEFSISLVINEKSRTK